MFTSREQQEIDNANSSGKTLVVFIHGLWLLAESWQPWRDFFEEQGFVTLAPGWPDDPETVEQAKAAPDVFADKSLKEITDHHQEVIAALDHKPVVVGHSFGGLITQKLAGRGLATVSVAISPAPFRGVLPLPFPALRSSFPVLGNPLNRGKAIALSFDQFRYAFGNEVSEVEARELYEAHSVAGAGRPIFEAATANVNPGTDASVDTHIAHRGPLLIISGDGDHTVPPAIARATYKRYSKNPSLTGSSKCRGWDIRWRWTAAGAKLPIRHWLSSSVSRAEKASRVHPAPVLNRTGEKQRVFDKPLSPQTGRF